MRKALLIAGLLFFFAAGAGAGYFYAIHQRGAPAGANVRGANAEGPAPADGLYTDEEVAVMRKKLEAIPLPISQDTAFFLLGIDKARIDKHVNFGGGQSDKNVANHWTWRLSPGFALAMYQEYGPSFGPEPPQPKPITRIAIGKAVPHAGNPEFHVALDETEKARTEVSLPRPGKRARWEEWKYPHLTKTVASWPDRNDFAGGFVGLTTDDFDTVASFYYQKCDVPNGTITLGKSPYTPADGDKLEYLMFRGFNSAVQAGLPAGQVRFLNVQTPAYTVGVALVQPQGQMETQIFVNVWCR